MRVKRVEAVAVVATQAVNETDSANHVSCHEIACRGSFVHVTPTIDYCEYGCQVTDNRKCVSDYRIVGMNDLF